MVPDQRGDDAADVLRDALDRLPDRRERRADEVEHGRVVVADENTLVVLELDTAPGGVARFVPDLDLGPVEE